MVEVWKEIKGYEGLYKISNLGNIKNRYNRYLKNRCDKGGYQKITLRKNSISKTYYVHRLVAMAFIPNPEDKPQINHKNEIRDCNRADNLEWCTAKYNNNYGNRINNVSDALSIPIIGVSDSGESFYFRSGMAASIIVGALTGSITNVLKGKHHTTKGYTFRYLTENEIEEHKDELLPRIECQEELLNKYKEFYLNREKKDIRRKISELLEDGTDYIYESIAEASRATGIERSLIYKNASGKSKTTHGRVFKYA